MDPAALTQALVDAIKQAQGSQLNAASINKTNAFGVINNTANHHGSLYSTAPATQQTQYLGTTYLPKVSDINLSAVGNTVNAQTNLINTQRQIDAQNKAASVLNGINFDQYGATV